MDLREMLEGLLRSELGIESEADLIKAVDESRGIDLGIFVNPQKGEIKSA